MESVIRKIGNAAGLILPALLLKKLGLKTGDRVVLSEQSGGLLIRKASQRPRYTLDELLAQCDLDTPDESKGGEAQS